MTRRLALDDIFAVAVPEQPALSPDGGSVVYVLRTADKAADKDVRSLWRVDTAGDARPHRLTRGKADTTPVFSPDGRRIAFLRAADGPAQIWLLPADGGEPEQLTELPMGAGTPVWSPDGESIAFTAPVDLHAIDGQTPDAGAPQATDVLGYKADGAGRLGTLRTQLHVVAVADGAVHQLTFGDSHAGQPAWSPDGATLAFTAASGDKPDLSYASGVYTVSATPGPAAPELVGPDSGSIGTVDWLDADTLLLIGSEQLVTSHAHLLLLDRRSGTLTNLSKPLDRNVMAGAPGYPGALPEVQGRDILFCIRDAGYTNLYRVPATGGAATAVIAGDRTVSGISVAGRRLAAVVATPTSYGEIVLLDADGAERVLTDCGASTAEIDLFVPQPRAFTISDGTTVHGWVLRDPEITGPTPLLLDVHGGPHNAWSGAADPVHLYHQVLAAKGWTALILNPRGSDGYGEQFYTAVIGGWGTSDQADFLEPIDALVAAGEADPDRLAITGYSYGGYTTCYLTSRDQRFAAAIPGGIVSDLTSLSGTSDAGHLLGYLEVGDLPYVDPERFAASSPYSRVADVTTPTLILHGGSDERCPVGQAEQWFTALRERGVPTRLVLYPGGAHLFILTGPLSHRIDYSRRVVEWVEQYAGVKGAAPRKPLDAKHWQRRLSEIATRYGVPGAALGILRLDGQDAEIVRAHHGVLNIATGVEVTDDSVFQLGSMGKVWTTTVAMQLVDEGRIGLDQPIVEVMPEFRLSDPEVTKKLTLRHLLTHTSGIDGDLFAETGRGDDCLEKYVALLSGQSMNHPLGATFSYCNAGFNLVGRLIEVLTGKVWDQAMRERLYQPLGLTKAGTLPEEAIMHRAAVGHVAGDGTGAGATKLQPAPVWGLPRSAGPAGLINTCVDEVLAFVRMHLSGGLAADGTRVLSAESVALMPQHQVDLPDKFALGDSWGLGWIRFDWNGHALIGHDGNTIGQSSFLRILPEQNIAVTLLTNGPGARDLYQDLFDEIFTELAGVSMPDPLVPATEPVAVDTATLVGRYERAGNRMTVFEGESGRLRLRVQVTGELAALNPDPIEVELHPVAENLFAYRMEGSHSWSSAVFYRLSTGELYLHTGVRATPKVSDEA